MTPESSSPPAPGRTELGREILARLAGSAEPDGFIPFDRFMEVALYADGLGFYAGPESPLGPAGSFYTAAHVSPLFAETLGAHLGELAERLGPELPLRLVEVGPGDGSLAEGVLRSFANGPGAAPFREFLLVERSRSLRDAAVARATVAAGPRGPVVRGSGSVSEDGPFNGIVFANELLDAQPVRRLRFDGPGWTELGVRRDGDRLLPAEAPCRVAPPGAPLPSVEPGTVVEVAPAAEAFLREVADHLERGVLLLVDYGTEESELVRAHPRGSLAAIRSHRFEDDPIAEPGRLDLSTFVNFTRIRDAARRAGLVEVYSASQAEALGAWGLPARLEAAVASAGSAEAQVRLRLAAKSLLFGFERFRVFEFTTSAVAAGRLPVT